MLPALACQMRCSVIQKGYGTTFPGTRKAMGHQKDSPDISPQYTQSFSPTNGYISASWLQPIFQVLPTPNNLYTPWSPNVDLGVPKPP